MYPVTQFNQTILSAVDMTTDQTSVSSNIKECRLVAVHLIYAAGATGSLQIQASNDDSNWTAVSTTALSGSAGSVMYNVEAGFAFIRVFYDATSGSGALTATINAKN